ncbi:MAG TPA: hypothetical protein VFK45_08310 [Gammaproteobacteria bacterium]|nr:hypothetical protein [Gammaproteobacteria bacterium]
MSTIARCFGFFAVLMLSLPIAAPATQRPDAQHLVNAAITAMGGQQALTAIRAVKLEGVGHRNMLEQSIRPSGPWLPDYFKFSELRDFAHQRKRVSEEHGGFGAIGWMTNQDGWLPLTYVVADGATARITKAGAAPNSPRALTKAEEDLALGPARVLLTALAAPNLHTEADVMLHGYQHHVVAWRWQGFPVRLYLNPRSALPAAVEWVRPYPYNVFLNVWGDVTTRVTYGLWSLLPDGLRYPRFWSVERNGQPAMSRTIAAIHLNPAIDDSAFDIPDDVRAAYANRARTIDALPLGSAKRPPQDVAPGVVQIAGAWNVALIRQNDGIVILEGPISSAYSARVIDAAKKQFPGLPVKAVVTTSDAWPHIGGLREYVAQGIAVYALDLNTPILKRLFTAPHTFRPDALAKQPRAPRLTLVSTRTRLGSGANRLELIPYRTQTGERQMLVYFPASQVLYTSDLFAPIDAQHWFTPETVLEANNAVQREHLQVKTAFGMHYSATPWENIVQPGAAVKRNTRS